MVFRALQYKKWYETGYLSISSKPKLRELSSNTYEIDGDGGLGIRVRILLLKKP